MSFFSRACATEKSCKKDAAARVLLRFYAFERHKVLRDLREFFFVIFVVAASCSSWIFFVSFVVKNQGAGFGVQGQRGALTCIVHHVSCIPDFFPMNPYNIITRKRRICYSINNSNLSPILCMDMKLAQGD
jgi:hypothetical protein